MKRTIDRLGRWLVLISLFSGLLTRTQVALVQAASPAMAAIVPLAVPPQPNLPRPVQAGPAGYTAAQAEAAAETYDQHHTLNKHYFDGNFNEPPRETKIFNSGPYTVVSANTPDAVFDLPGTAISGGAHDSVTVDILLQNATWPWGNTVIDGVTPQIEIKPITGTDWINAKLMEPSDYDRPLTTVHLTLNPLYFPPSVPISVRLRCGSFWNQHNGSCRFSNFRFNDDAVGWERAPLEGHAINVNYAMGVLRTPLGTIAPEDGGFFGWEKLTRGGPESGPLNGIRYLGPRVQMPTFALTDTLTGTLRWMDQAFLATDERVKIQIGFIADDDPARAFIPLAETGGGTGVPPLEWSTSVPFTRTGNHLFELSGKHGIMAIHGGTWITPPQRTGLDSFRLYLNGAPLALPLTDEYMVPDDQATGECICQEDGSHVGQAQGYYGEPVNTHSGAFYFKTTDMEVPVSGPPLRMERAYISMFADTSRFHTTWMGPGWRYSTGQILLMPDDIGGEPQRVVYEYPNGNRLRFDDLGNGAYRALPGIRATLAYSAANQTYTLTSRDHEVLIFDQDGRILEYRDAQGRAQISIYGDDPSKPSFGQRLQVKDVTSGRSLWFGYITIGDLTRVSSVSNDLGASVTYDYTANGELETVTDLRGGVTSYVYASDVADGPRYLTVIRNPGDNPAAPYLTNVYQNGRIASQTDAAGLTMSFAYAPAANGGQITTVTQQKSGEPADVIKHHYRRDGSLRMTEQNGRFTGYTAFRSNFATSATLDGNLHAQTIATNAAGLPTSSVDAAGGVTSTTYDAQNRATRLQDADGLDSTFSYDAQNNVTGVVRQAAGGMQLTNVLTHTNNQLHAERHQDGSVTTYTYTPAGDVATITSHAGTLGAVTIRYMYDAIGRRTDAIVGDGTPLALRTHLIYRPDGRVDTAIQNYQGNGQFNPSYPEQNLTTRYGYDLQGRLIWTQDPAGGYHDYVRYDAMSRILWRVQNPNPLPAATAPAPTYNPQTPDRNVVTLYGYDGLGHVTLITETGILTGTFDRATRTFSQATSRMTRIEYDGLGRPVTTTLNYRPDLAQGQFPDINLKAYTYYDGVGNAIWQSDALGRWTHIEYDALNRPVTTTLNYENGIPDTVDSAHRTWTDGTDTDIISVAVYDAQGQPTKTIENYVNGVFTASEPLTDRINLVDTLSIGRAITTTANYDPATVGQRPDTNQVSIARFDPLKGRLQATRDALGQWSTVEYDSAGRVQTQIANCTLSNGTPTPQGCYQLDAINAPDRNIPTTIAYDALGRTLETTVAQQRTTRTAYDALGRIVATTEHYVANGPATADTNVMSQTRYNTLGQVTARIDPLGRTIAYAYNALGAQTSITDPTGAITTIGYDGRGVQRWIRAADGTFTVTLIDGLGRPTSTVRNYENGIVTAADGTDRDSITAVVYDRANRQIATIDPLGRETDFTYTLMNQIASVTENARLASQCQNVATNDCNLISTYRYDRAGNQIAFIDANSNMQRKTTYNAASWPTSVRDALGYEQMFTYDAAGRVLQQTTGEATLLYGYNARNQIVQAQTVMSEVVHTKHYDVLGRMTQAKTVRAMPASTVQVQYGYDALDRITSTTQTVNPSSVTAATSYVYDKAGQVIQLTYPNLKATNYTYTSRGELDTVAENQVVLADYTYDAVGFVQHAAFSNDLELIQTRDGLGQPLQREYRLLGDPIVAETYALNRRGERVSRTEQRTAAPSTETYAYDNVGRLASATLGSTIRSYGYDRVGNRTNVTVNGQTTTRTYNAANQVTNTGWLYDYAGNLRADGTQTYTFDGFGQLTDTTRGSLTIANLYAPDGAMVRQTITKGTSTQRLDYTVDWAAPLSQILFVKTTTSQGTTNERSVFGLERLFTTADTGKPVVRNWLLTDALGSVVATTTATGAPAVAQTYDPWGQAQAVAPSRFGYTGELTNSDTGLVYLRARWYNAADGTLLSRDPFAGSQRMPSSQQPYLYAVNNPVSYTDPTGRTVCDSVKFDPIVCRPESGTVPARAPGATSARTRVVICNPYTAVDELLKQIPARWLQGPEYDYQWRVDLAYIEGVSGSASLGIGASVSGTHGWEAVYDLYDFEVGTFSFSAGAVNVGDNNSGSLSGSVYAGFASGWSNFSSGGVTNYAGPSEFMGINFDTEDLGKLMTRVGAGLGFSLSYFSSLPDGKIYGVIGGPTLGAGISLGFDIPGGVTRGRADYKAISVITYPRTMLGGLAFASTVMVLSNHLFFPFHVYMAGAILGSLAL